MSNICAGIGRGQMEVLGERVAKRREHFYFYKKALQEIDRIQFLSEPSEDYFSNHWLTTFVITEGSNREREDLRAFLQERNIETRPLWKPMHLQPVFEKYPSYVNGVSEDLFNRGICLPSSSNLSDADRDLVVASITEFFGIGSRA